MKIIFFKISNIVTHALAAKIFITYMLNLNYKLLLITINQAKKAFLLISITHSWWKKQLYDLAKYAAKSNKHAKIIRLISHLLNLNKPGFKF